MMKVRRVVLLLRLCLIIVSLALVGGAGADTYKDIPVKGKVTLVDLGANACVPCKLMAPILEKLKKAYDGKAAIIVIDVWQNRDQAGRFGVQAIPTQIFFNEKGKEVYRHVGFMSEAAIIKQLKKMGVE